MHSIIQVRSASQSGPQAYHPGRYYGPTFLVQFNYPPLGTWGRQQPTATVTNVPDNAHAYTDADTLDSALALLHAIGYEPVAVEVPEHRPGMDGMTGRCLTCDGRYCGTECTAQEGYVYVNGKGWACYSEARREERNGRTVDWDLVWTESDGGHWVPTADYVNGAR